MRSAAANAGCSLDFFRQRVKDLATKFNVPCQVLPLPAVHAVGPTLQPLQQAWAKYHDQRGDQGDAVTEEKEEPQGLRQHRAEVAARPVMQRSRKRAGL